MMHPVKDTLNNNNKEGNGNLLYPSVHSFSASSSPIMNHAADAAVKDAIGNATSNASSNVVLHAYLSYEDIVLPWLDLPPLPFSLPGHNVMISNIDSISTRNTTSDVSVNQLRHWQMFKFMNQGIKGNKDFLIKPISAQLHAHSPFHQCMCICVCLQYSRQYLASWCK